MKTYDSHVSSIISAEYFCMLKFSLRMTELTLKENSLQNLIDLLVCYALNNEEFFTSENVEEEISEYALSLRFEKECFPVYTLELRI